MNLKSITIKPLMLKSKYLKGFIEILSLKTIFVQSKKLLKNMGGGMKDRGGLAATPSPPLPIVAIGMLILQPPSETATAEKILLSLVVSFIKICSLNGDYR